MVTDPTSALSQSTTTVQQLLRPYPQYTGITQSSLPYGRSWYHSLQLEVSKRMASGLYFGASYTNSKLIEATSPFVFSAVNERSILRFLKLIACDNGKIGTYAKLVDDRNDTAHSNGNIFYSTQAALDVKITEILRVVDEIQNHSKPVIEHCYRDFLLQNHDTDEREYADPADQIREVLIHGNYLSQKDIEICLAFDVAAFAQQPMNSSVRELHECLKSGYGEN